MSVLTSSGGVSARAEKFARAAAAQALQAVSIGQCKQKKGPKGSGHVVVRFRPSGTAEAAKTDTAPFAGTKVGSCIERAYKKARVPAFEGEAVTVGKKFVLE